MSLMNIGDSDREVRGSMSTAVVGGGPSLVGTREGIYGLRHE